MDTSEFESKLASLPEAEPDTADQSMIAHSAMQDDGTLIPLRDFRELMEYSGKLSLRIPRSLHMKLVEDASIEGISLNQYALYKLSK